MSDSIFDRLFELFQSPGPVNWKLAAEIRKSLAGAGEPVEPDLADEYMGLALAAQLRLESATHLGPVSTDRMHPVDAATWAAENEQSFRYAIEPLAGKLTGGPIDPANPMSAMLAPMGPAILGMQAGTMVGFMAHRALGQFDTGLPALDNDRLYLVVSNVEGFALDHGLDPKQVRMWAAAKEVFHHTVLAVPWFQERLVALVEDFYAEVSFDPTRLTETLSNMDDPSELEGMVGGAGGLAALLGGEHDEAKLAPIQALLATVEGYGDHVVERALADVLQDRERIGEAFARRRVEPNQAEQFLQQLVGLELERHRARDAADLFAQIERRWGDEAVVTLWSASDNVPSLDELTDPVGWAARVLI